MSVRDFMASHRDELLQACSAELDAGVDIARLGGELAEQLVSLLRQTQRSSIATPEAPLVGSHARVVRARAALEQLSQRTRTPVLLLGELGTGKRHWLRALHAASYPQGELFELEGQEGLGELESRVARLRARSGNAARAGLTLYVHAVNESAPPVQVQLVRLLREQRLALRIVVSSTRPLTQACREGQLRSELVFGFPSVIELPPLRDRVSDLPALVQHFIAQASARFTLSAAALSRLQEHRWPGNLTELRNLVLQLAEAGASGELDTADLPELGEPPLGARFSLPAGGLDLAELERELLAQALAMAENNQTRAARLLGLTRDQIRYRLAKFDLLQSAPG